MSIQKVPGRLLGYDPEQVDGLLDRVKRQYDNPNSRIVTPGMLSVAKFELVPGGYRIDQVDAAIAKVADDFEIREVTEKISKFGRGEIKKDNRKLIGMVAEVLARSPKERFNPSRNGYRFKQVEQLLSLIKVTDGQLTGPEPMEIRTCELGSSKSGPNRSEVNEFLAMVVTALHTQRLLG
jgi:DivIVA domain-containing protein